MLNCAVKILEKLEIPYQVVLLSSGDMGFSSEKTFDIEAWIPLKINIERYQLFILWYFSIKKNECKI